MRNAFILSLAFATVLWVLQSASVLFDWPIGILGVFPGDWSRAYGALTYVLAHGSYEHLFNNTLPILVLGTALIYGYPHSRWKVIAISWIGSGVGIWLFAREANHVGASGLTHGVFFFLLVCAMLRRDKRSVVLMMVAFLMYGGMIMSIFPREPGISYEAHFFGAAAGAVCALLFYRRDPKPEVKRYTWEDNDDDDPIIGDQWRGDEYSETEQVARHQATHNDHYNQVRPLH